MGAFQESKELFEMEVERMAKMNLDRRLKKQGIDPGCISSNEYRALMEKEIRLLGNDAKKVGVGVAIGLTLSLLTGF